MVPLSPKGANVTTDNIMPSDLGSPELARLREMFLTPPSENSTRRTFRLTSPEGDSFEVPPALVCVIKSMIHTLSRGAGVAVLPIGADLTTSQVATLLGVSRPHVVKLLDEGAMPFHFAGSHRRVKLLDALAFRRDRDEQAQRALTELEDITVALDLPR